MPSDDLFPALASRRVPRHRQRILFIVCFLASAVLSLALYWPSLGASFYSDDMHYVVYNDYLHELTAANFLEIINPHGTVAMMTQNFAPVHLLGHALEWQLFGASPAGYHVVNVLLHALASTLFGLLLLASGAPAMAALLGGSAFLLHPANVEAVAWISQLKTSLALVLALGALLVRERRPPLALLLFALAIFCKLLAVFALPVAILFQWTLRPALGATEQGTGDAAPAAEGPRPSWGSPWLWIAGWALVFMVATALEFPLFRITNLNAPPLHPEFGGQIRGVVVVGARYLGMAASGSGMSAFHEALPTDSWLEPWPLIGITACLLLGARLAYTLSRRRIEAVYWAWALISFAPISQVFPFLYPMADRYLYFILPGLIGGGVFASLALSSALFESRRPGLERAFMAVVAIWLVWIGVQCLERTILWSDPGRVDADAITNYPEGLLATIVYAQQAAVGGDAELAVQMLRRGFERGNMHFWSLRDEAVWDSVRHHPGFTRVMQDMARYWVRVEHRYLHPSQIDLRAFADAYALLGDYEAARQRLERALEHGGVRDEEVQRALVRVRLEIAKQQRDDSPSTRLEAERDERQDE